jgi:hypothetical protein
MKQLPHSSLQAWPWDFVIQYLLCMPSMWFRGSLTEKWMNSSEFAGRVKVVQLEFHCICGVWNAPQYDSVMKCYYTHLKNWGMSLNHIMMDICNGMRQKMSAMQCWILWTAWIWKCACCTQCVHRTGLPTMSYVHMHNVQVNGAGHGLLENVAIQR